MFLTPIGSFLLLSLLVWVSDAWQTLTIDRGFRLIDKRLQRLERWTDNGDW